MKPTDSPLRESSNSRPQSQPLPTGERPAPPRNSTPDASIPASAQPVHFEFFDPAASKVSIAGTFNCWNPEGTEMNRLSLGRWEKDLLLPPGDYEYRLVVDGRWIPDPGAPCTVPGPFGDPNSLLTVPALKA